MSFMYLLYYVNGGIIFRRILIHNILRNDLRMMCGVEENKINCRKN